MVSFDTISDVEAWARQHGGLDAVNEALAGGTFGQDTQTIRTAIRYVEREELKIAQKLGIEDRRGRALTTAELAANAAQRSARAAAVACWIAVAAAVIAVFAVLFGVMRQQLADAWFRQSPGVALATSCAHRYIDLKIGTPKKQAATAWICEEKKWV